MYRKLILICKKRFNPLKKYITKSLKQRFCSLAQANIKASVVIKFNFEKKPFR